MAKETPRNAGVRTDSFSRGWFGPEFLLDSDRFWLAGGRQVDTDHYVTSTTVVAPVPGPSPTPSPTAALDNEVLFNFGTPAAGQTQFILPKTPTQPERTQLIINNMIYGTGSFTISGRAITWGNAFTISPNDTISVNFV